MTRQFFITRVSADREDPTALDFWPPKGSDELHEALKNAFPREPNLAARMRQAVIEFLLQEQQAESLASYSPDYLPSPQSSFVSTIPSPAVPMAQAELQTSPPASRLTAQPSQQQLMDVWTLSDKPQAKVHTRRNMTPDEKKAYKAKRLVGACGDCKRRRRKCEHNPKNETPTSPPRKAGKSKKRTAASASACNMAALDEASTSELSSSLLESNLASNHDVLAASEPMALEMPSFALHSMFDAAPDLNTDWQLFPDLYNDNGYLDPSLVWPNQNTSLAPQLFSSGMADSPMLDIADPIQKHFAPLTPTSSYGSGLSGHFGDESGYQRPPTILSGTSSHLTKQPRNANMGRLASDSNQPSSTYHLGGSILPDTAATSTSTRAGPSALQPLHSGPQHAPLAMPEGSSLTQAPGSQTAWQTIRTLTGAPDPAGGSGVLTGEIRRRRAGSTHASIANGLAPVGMTPQSFIVGNHHCDTCSWDDLSSSRRQDLSRHLPLRYVERDCLTCHHSPRQRANALPVVTVSDPAYSPQARSEALFLHLAKHHVVDIGSRRAIDATNNQAVWRTIADRYGAGVQSITAAKWSPEIADADSTSGIETRFAMYRDLASPSLPLFFGLVKLLVLCLVFLGGLTSLLATPSDRVASLSKHGATVLLLAAIAVYILPSALPAPQIWSHFWSCSRRVEDAIFLQVTTLVQLAVVGVYSLLAASNKYSFRFWPASRQLKERRPRPSLSNDATTGFQLALLDAYTLSTASPKSSSRLGSYARRLKDLSSSLSLAAEQSEARSLTLFCCNFQGTPC